MTYSNDADLNAFADSAGYDEWRLHDADPGTDYTASVHAGPYAISLLAAGVAGPNGSLHPATPGRRYSDSPTSVTLTVACGWESVRNSTTGAVRIYKRPRGPIGPGTFPMVYALDVSNR